MRISDWSSDVCSSDLEQPAEVIAPVEPAAPEPEAEPSSEQEAEPKLQSEPAAIPKPATAPEKGSWLARLKKGLSRTGQNIGGLFVGVKVDEDLFEELDRKSTRLNSSH